MLIGDLLNRDLTKRISEVIQVDQEDEEAVRTEIFEYVVTDRIREHYRELLKAIADTPVEQHDSVGVWVSGFFGSGKSSFAKNLGYLLANPTLLGISAAELFKQRVADRQISDYIDFINKRIPTEVVMFDVQKDRAQSGSGNTGISLYIYRVLLRHFGYAEDFDLAELEISLEREGRLFDFIKRYNARYAEGDPKKEWARQGRKSVEKWNRTGVILHEMDPSTYPAVESFARGLAQKQVEVTPRLLVERTFELAARRAPGKAVAYIIDEVGQYVAYDQSRLEDLRAIVELFGKESKNRLKSRSVVGPVWFVVTAQERLDEVTSAMGDEKRVLFAKVRDRFSFEIDLSPADIKEVATKRVLDKTDAGVKELRRLYYEKQGQLTSALRLDSNQYRVDLNEANFVQFYPYPPHFIELSIYIASGIRLQPGAPRSVGGSNRTIIKQAYEMLVSPRTDMKAKPLGRLVTLDLVYELVEPNLSSQRQSDIAGISERFKGEPDDRGWATRVAKAIMLLELVRNLARTEGNLAAVLVDEVGKPSPLEEVKSALARLEKAGFIKNGDEGYKLLTVNDRNWEDAKRGFVPKPKDRIGGFQAVELMPYHTEADVAALRALGCTYFLMRLPDSIAADGRLRGDIEYANMCIALIKRFYPLGVRDYQLDNEPNLSWGLVKAGTWRWLLDRTVSLIKQSAEVPRDVRLGLAPLAWNPETWRSVEQVWIPEQRKIADQYQFYCVHSYWQAPQHYNSATASRMC
jgi:hypothetical protein